MLKTILLAHRHKLKLWEISLACNLANCTTVKAFPQLRTHSTAAVACPTSSPSPLSQIPKRLDSPYKQSDRVGKAGCVAILKQILKDYRKRKGKENAVQLVRSQPLLAPYTNSPKTFGYLINGLATSDTPQDTIEALRFAHDYGLQLNDQLFTNICFHFTEASRWDLVLRTVSFAQMSTGRSTARLLNWRARALLETSEFRQLGALLQEFEEYGAKPNRITFHLLLKAYLRNHDLLGAKSCLEQMEKACIPLDASTHAVIAQSYRSLGGDANVEERALEHLPLMPQSTQLAVLNNLLRGHLDNKDLQNALRILSLFEQTSVEVVTAALFGENTDGEAVRSAHQFSMPPIRLPKPLQPNASTFAVLMHYCSARRNFGGALQLLHCMIAQGVVPTAHVVTALIHACFVGNRPDLAVQLVIGICDSEATPRSLFEPIYSGSWDVPFFEVHVPGMKPTVKIFNSLILGILSSHGIDGAIQVLRIMEVNKVQPDTRTLDVILSHVEYVEKARPRTLIRLLYSLSDTRLTASPKHLRVIFRSILRTEKSNAWSLGWNASKFPATARRPSTPSGDPHVNNFDIFAGIEYPPYRFYNLLSRPFFKVLDDKGIKPDPGTLSMRVRFEAVIRKDMKAAQEVFQAMLARGMQPNAYHFAALMEGCAITGDARAAHKVFETAQSHGVMPSVVLYTILITAHGRRRRPDEALRTFQQMVDQGLGPDVPSIDAVVGAFYAANAGGMAKRVLVSLWEYIQPFPSQLASSTLFELAEKFRQLYSNPGIQLKPISTERRLELHLKLGDLVKEWDRLRSRKDASHRPWKERIRPCSNVAKRAQN
ncbi:hypothetical protein FA15DRAFT_607925 [Coprinopsis marcescibilis]|uniref:Pentacotripeptide-repeat region of PRORP domain-containing protein n=1 Tax=Coprinopsis marcescibilis TaxID=230819 RepID=A0A5C3LD21_COPMA|nr:hypothetical protein FA15DRAFT_607925 [Coprinopsis marcescibilis]